MVDLHNLVKLAEKFNKLAESDLITYLPNQPLTYLEKRLSMDYIKDFNIAKEASNLLNKIVALHDAYRDLFKVKNKKTSPELTIKYKKLKSMEDFANHLKQAIDSCVPLLGHLVKTNKLKETYEAADIAAEMINDLLALVYEEAEFKDALK